MRIVINASPERMISMSFFDGMDNQLFPPMNCAAIDVENIIKGFCDEHDISEIDIAGPQLFIQNLGKRLQTQFNTVNVKLV